MLNKDLARLDPAAVFAVPEEVRDHGDLTREEKIEILKRWAYDDAEADVAGEEGMPGETPNDLQQRIFAALDSLGGEAAFEPTSPTKQHGLPGRHGSSRRDADD